MVTNTVVEVAPVVIYSNEMCPCQHNPLSSLSVKVVMVVIRALVLTDTTHLSLVSIPPSVAVAVVQWVLSLVLVAVLAVVLLVVLSVLVVLVHPDKVTLVDQMSVTMVRREEVVPVVLVQVTVGEAVEQVDSV